MYFIRQGSIRRLPISPKESELAIPASFLFLLGLAQSRLQERRHFGGYEDVVNSLPDEIMVCGASGEARREGGRWSLFRFNGKRRAFILG